MNNFNNRNRDLSQVFDQRWKANTINDKKIKEDRKQFNFKMFGIRDKEDVRKELRQANTVDAKVERLNQKMAGLSKLNRNNFR